MARPPDKQREVIDILVKLARPFLNDTRRRYG
jgi:hypothetical protein